MLHIRFAIIHVFFFIWWIHCHVLFHCSADDTTYSDDTQYNDDSIGSGPIPLNTTVTDCSEYTHRIRINNDDVIVDYVFTNESMSVYMEYNVLAWIAFGISPDSKGKMVGSDAIIGLPEEDISSTNPGKYIMVRTDRYLVSVLHCFISIVI